MRIYICSIEELTDAASYDAASLKIEPNRKEKLTHIKKEADKRRCVGAGLLLNYVLYQFRSFPAAKEENCAQIVLQEVSIKELLEAPTQEYRCQKKENGKPFLAEEENFFFSLSHSGDYVLCAEAPFEIGADLQLCEKEVKPGMAQKLLTEREYEAYTALPELEQKKAFYFAWTIKESGCKLTGKGLAQVFDHMEILWGEKKLLFSEENSSAVFFAGCWKENYCFAVSSSSDGQN